MCNGNSSSFLQYEAFRHWSECSCYRVQISRVRAVFLGQSSLNPEKESMGVFSCCALTFPIFLVLQGSRYFNTNSPHFTQLYLDFSIPKSFNIRFPSQENPCGQLAQIYGPAPQAQFLKAQRSCEPVYFLLTCQQSPADLHSMISKDCQNIQCAASRPSDGFFSSPGDCDNKTGGTHWLGSLAGRRAVAQNF